MKLKGLDKQQVKALDLMRKSESVRQAIKRGGYGAPERLSEKRAREHPPLPDMADQSPEISVLFQNLTKLTNIPTHHEVKEFPTIKDAAETRRKLGFLVQEVIDVLNNPCASAKLLQPDKSRKGSKRRILDKKDS